MKNKSEIRSRLISSIKVILAVGAMIAICTFISKTNQFEAYAETTASALDWELKNTPKVKYKDGGVISDATATPTEGVIIYTIGEKSGQERITTSSTSKIGTIIDVDGNVESVKYQLTQFTISPTSYSPSGTIEPIDGVVSKASGASKAKAVFDLSQIEIITTTYGNIIKSLSADTIEINVTEAKDINKVKAKLPITFNANVTLNGSSTVTKWTGANLSNSTIDWDTSPTGYDKSKDVEYSFTWIGNLPKDGAIIKDTTTAHAAVGIPVTVTFKVVKDTDYEKLIDNYSSDLIDEEITNSGDFEIKVSDFDDDFVKAVLKYLLNNGDDDDDYVKDIKNAVSGSSTKIKLTFKIKDGDPSSKAKERMKDAAKEKKNGSISDYFDLSLKLTIGNKEYEVSDIGSKNSLEFKVKVPSDSRKSSRQYNTVRDHDDKSKLLNDSYKDLSDDKWLSFKSYLFSDYAIAYTDSSSSSSKSSSSSSSRSSSVAGARTTTTGGTSSGNAAGGSRTGSGAPKTGDEFNAKLWIYFLVVGVVVALCAFILYQDTKDWRDEKKEAK